MGTPTSDDGNIDYNNVYSSKVLFIHSSPRRPLLHTVNVLLLLLFLVLNEQFWKMNSGDEAEKTHHPRHPPPSKHKACCYPGRERYLVGGWWWMEWKFWLKMVINKISNRVFSGGGVNLLIVSSFHFIYQSKSNLWQFIATEWKWLDGETKNLCGLWGRGRGK